MLTPSEERQETVLVWNVHTTGGGPFGSRETPSLSKRVTCWCDEHRETGPGSMLLRSPLLAYSFPRQREPERKKRVSCVNTSTPK